jgi:hypothetical protein
LKGPYQLVQNGFSDDTVKALETLLADAKAGKVIGLAFVAMYRRREYTASATGEARRNPTFTRGMLAALDDLMGDMVGR